VLARVAARRNRGVASAGVVPAQGFLIVDLCAFASRRDARSETEWIEWIDFAPTDPTLHHRTKETSMKGARTKKELSSTARRDELLGTLKARFEMNTSRHPGVDWARVKARLEAMPDKLRSLGEMEGTGGEPDVVGHDPKTGEYVFFDCSPQSPEGRTSLCYDRKALDTRKEHKPKSSAMDMAAAMGIELLTEEEYRELQALGEFDTKSSSWLRTPAEIRKLGGAIFGDRRFGRVFVYHNGAQSYYSGRGYRGSVRV
jgi:hypothetical protein